jgi:hypothetical protein
VSWNVEFGPNNGRNCLGRLAREAGHKRVPAPPHMIRGTMAEAMPCSAYTEPSRPSLLARAFSLQTRSRSTSVRKNAGLASAAFVRFRRPSDYAALRDLSNAAGVRGSDEAYEAQGQAVTVMNTDIQPDPRCTAPFLPNFNGLGRGAMAFRKGPGQL